MDTGLDSGLDTGFRLLAVLGAAVVGTPAGSVATGEPRSRFTFLSTPAADRASDLPPRAVDGFAVKGPAFGSALHLLPAWEAMPCLSSLPLPFPAEPAEPAEAPLDELPLDELPLDDLPPFSPVSPFIARVIFRILCT